MIETTKKQGHSDHKVVNPRMLVGYKTAQIEFTVLLANYLVLNIELKWSICPLLRQVDPQWQDIVAVIYNTL